MALTCLQIIQTACKRMGLAFPNYIFGNSDQNVVQLLTLSEEEGQEQGTRYAWQALQSEATFTTVAAQVQCTIASCTTGFDYIVNDTIWNRTLRRPVYGPKSQQDWQQVRAMQINGPFNSFRIIGDVINFYPSPAVGQSCYFEYITKNWIATSGGTSPVWTADTDTPKLNDQLVILGLIWRYKAAKGLNYAEDFDKYENRLMDAMSRDAGKQILNMGGTHYDIQPGIFVPAGSW